MTETAAEPRPARWLALTAHPLARAAVPLAIVVIAFVVLHRLSGEVHLRDIRADLAATSPRAIALAILATVASFAAISLYDVIAARAVAPGTIPPRVAAVTCATGYALSNLLGFSYITGAAVRYRVYAGYGLDFPRVALLIAYSWSAFLGRADPDCRAPVRRPSARDFRDPSHLRRCRDGTGPRTSRRSRGVCPFPSGSGRTGSRCSATI
jgi:hypothetical protein